MAHVIDIILIALIVLIAFIGSRRGIILTVFDLLSGVASFVIAKLSAPYASSYIYDNVVREKVMAFLEEKYSGVETVMTETVESFVSVFDFLPDGILTYAEKSGLLDASSFSHDILSSITTVSELETDIVAPVVTAVINMLCFAVIAFVAVIVLRIIGKLLSGIVSKSKIGEKLDSGLGAAFGVLKGVIYVFIIAVIISIISFSSETVASYAADSYICGIAAQLIGI